MICSLASSESILTSFKLRTALLAVANAASEYVIARVNTIHAQSTPQYAFVLRGRQPDPGLQNVARPIRSGSWIVRHQSAHTFSDRLHLWSGQTGELNRLNERFGR